MTKSVYYDGTKLLSLKDVNGNTPELYIVSGNRSAGKTTYFNRYLIKKFIQKNEQFGIIVRYAYELDGIADRFFSDIKTLFFPEYNMIAKKRAKNTYAELLLQKGNTDEYVTCGYAVPLNNADSIKKCSHLLSKIERLVFDEFQPETGNYCDKEIEKFISVHKSIARGGGKFVRRVPVFMLSNCVSLINPYFLAFGIADKIQESTKFLRGNGVVFEQNYNVYSAKAQSESVFDNIFENQKAIAYAQQNIYLNDNKTFIEKPQGKNIYLATLIYENNFFSLREFTNNGFLYCGQDIDPNCQKKIALTTQDHNINYILIKNNAPLFVYMKTIFEKGAFRFQNLTCKQCILKCLQYI